MKIKCMSKNDIKCKDYDVDLSKQQWSCLEGPMQSTQVLVLQLCTEAPCYLPIEPHCEKTGLRGFRPGLTQTGLYSHRRWLEAGNLGTRGVVLSM